jgi:heat shock protein HtpX
MGLPEEYAVGGANWRKQLWLNERRTHTVILIFIAIHIFIGLLIDATLQTGMFNSLLTGTTYGAYSNFGPAMPTSLMSLKEILISLITFRIIPYATIILAGISIISILMTYAMYDRIMMAGTDYHEVILRDTSSIQEQQLYHVVEEMKVASGLRFMPRIYIIDADYMNAFASGYSEKSAMVAITRGLMEKLDRNELEAVMAHELSHVRHHDIKLTLTASVLSNIILFAIDLLFRDLIYDRQSRDTKTLFLIVFVLRMVLPIFTIVLMLYLSRTREYMADAGSVELMRDNQPLARALLKISGDHLDNKEAYRQSYTRTPHENMRREAYIFDPIQAGIEPVLSISGLFSTHPALKDRLAALGITKIIRSPNQSDLGE